MTSTIAVAGCGRWGRNLVRNFAELGALHTVCDVNAASLEAVRSQYPGVRVETDFNRILRDDEIHGVVVSTPAVTHCALARAALKAGKDVMVEKPLSLRTEEGEALVELAEEGGRVLLVGHVLQYHPAVVRLKEMVESGVLGKIHYIYSNRLNLGQFRTEENITWSFAPHDISIILALLGQMPISVSSHGGSYLQPGIADVTVTTMKFPNGAQGHVFVSWLHPHKEQRLVVIGDRGMAVFDDLKPDGKLTLHDYAVNWINRTPFPATNGHQVVNVPVEEPLRRECQHFLECIDGRHTPKTDGREGLRVLRVLDACQRSLMAGGKDVPLESEQPLFYVHETSVIDEQCTIGKGTSIWHFCHLMPSVSIGEGCTLGQNIFVGKGVSIGNHVKIQNNVSVFEGVVIEDNVFCGPSCVFTNVMTPRAALPRRDEFMTTIVKRGATIGANATVVCGTTIGRFAFIGAGGVVTRDVPDYALAYGNPARVLGWRCECGQKLTFTEEQARCPSCARRYTRGTSDKGPVVRPIEERTYASPAS